jgi:hypothetical protein
MDGYASGLQVDGDEAVSLRGRDHPQGEALPLQAMERRHRTTLEPLH